MSFLDELQSIAKTPQQVADEISDELTERHLGYIKNEIRTLASSGQYKLQGGKKVVNYRVPIIASDISAELGNSIIDIIPCGIKCEIKDKLLFDTYKRKLQELAKNEGIHVEIKCIFEENGHLTYFEVPGNPRLDHRTYTHLSRRTNVYLIGHCEF